MEQKTLQRVKKKEDAGPNLTGIPTQMKLNFEQRSGLSFDDVRVHYNSDKPAQELMAAPAVGGGVIQRVKEEEKKAVEETNSIVPGNKRSSVNKTGGESAWKVAKYREWFEETFWPKFQEKYRIDSSMENELRPFVHAVAVKMLEAGNCDEFSAVTYAYLAQNSENQWVYRCALVPEKKLPHSFTVTSKTHFEGSRLPDNADRNEITVVDGWDSKRIVSLKEFYEGKNLYGVLLDPSTKIYIDNSTQASNEKKVTPEMIAYIRHWMKIFFFNMPSITEKFKQDMQGDNSNIFENM